MPPSSTDFSTMSHNSSVLTSPLSSSTRSLSPPSNIESLDSTSITSAASFSRKKDFCIPQKWKTSIMTAIVDKRLYPEVRNEIVRDLVTHIYSHVEKPSITFVTKAASMLVEKYPFMADSACGCESSPSVSIYKLCC